MHAHLHTHVHTHSCAECARPPGKAGEAVFQAPGSQTCQRAQGTGHVDCRRASVTAKMAHPGPCDAARSGPRDQTEAPAHSEPRRGQAGQVPRRGWAQGARARESRLRARWPRPGRRPLRRHWRTEGRSLRRTRPSEEAPPCPLPSSQRSASRSTVPWDASGTRFHPVSRGTHSVNKEKETNC